MKAVVLSAVLSSAALANAAVLDARQQPPNSCILTARGLASDRSFVFPLVDTCTHSLESFDNPYSSKLCVAAAIAASPTVLRNMMTCTDDSVASVRDFPALDYNVYASIVGDCAWAPGGCDVTRQNLIDLIYSQIDRERGPVYPDVNDLVKYYIDPLFQWTATGSDSHTPYLNFNDWLHFAGQVGHCTPGDQSCPLSSSTGTTSESATLGDPLPSTSGDTSSTGTTTLSEVPTSVPISPSSTA